MATTVRDRLREGPRIEAALDRLDDNHPIAAAITRAATGMAEKPDNGIRAQDVAELVEAAKLEIARAPVARAEANIERWYENRYIVAGLAWAIGWFMQNVLHWNVVITEAMIVGVGPFLQVIGGQVFAAAATLRLPPIDWRRPWTIFQLRRKASA